MHAMLQSIKEGIVGVDNQSRLSIVNSEAKRLLKLSDLAQDLLMNCAS